MVDCNDPGKVGRLQGRAEAYEWLSRPDILAQLRELLNKDMGET